MSFIIHQSPWIGAPGNLAPSPTECKHMHELKHPKGNGPGFKQPWD